MKLDLIIANAYGHFLYHYNSYEKSKPIFERYAKEELNLPEEELEGFMRKTIVEDENEINSAEFDRFYIWYYFNYMFVPLQIPFAKW